MSKTDQRQEAIKKLGKLISDIPVAMLVTSTPQHELRSRPMVNVNSKFDGDLWFFTHQQDPKVREVIGNPQVNVSFVATDQDRYVSVSGRASAVQDEKRLELLWTDDCKKWFPDGRNDPQLSLLRIDVDYAEYWDAKTGLMKQISGIMTQAMTGKTDEQSVKHEKIDWQQRPNSPGVGD